MEIAAEQIYRNLLKIDDLHVEQDRLQEFSKDLSIFMKECISEAKVFINPKTFCYDYEILLANTISKKIWRYSFPTGGSSASFLCIREV